MSLASLKTFTNALSGMRELARRAESSPGYVTRILALLESEDVLPRDTKGAITKVNWSALLKRWAQDYAVASTNRAFAYLEPRSTEAFLDRLRDYKTNWALTGSRAVPRAASSAPARTISCYLDNPEKAGTGREPSEAQALLS
jgi:hypothetical protein